MRNPARDTPIGRLGLKKRIAGRYKRGTQKED